MLRMRASHSSFGRTMKKNKLEFVKCLLMPDEFNTLSNLILVTVLKDTYYYACFFLIGKLWLREVKCFS